MSRRERWVVTVLMLAVVVLGVMLVQVFGHIFEEDGVKHKQRLRWEVEQQKRYEVYYFVVDVSNPADVQVMQVEERPAWTTEERESILTIGLADSKRVHSLADVALCISWLPFKPAPESEMRNRGLVAVWRNLAERSGQPELIEHISVGHVYGAKAEWDEHLPAD